MLENMSDDTLRQNVNGSTVSAPTPVPAPVSAPVSDASISTFAATSTYTSATATSPTATVPTSTSPTFTTSVSVPVAAPVPTPYNPDAAVSIRGLVKRFGTKTAVGRLSLDIPAGSFYGLVGPNGAGKTTTLNMVTGLLTPDMGGAAIFGVDVWRDVNAAKRMIGVMPQQSQIFDRLTGFQLLVYAVMLRGMKRAETVSRARDLLAAFDLADAADKMVIDYSAGMTKKICLASAMIHSPRLLVLDEPFESVDPVSSANLKDILAEYAATGGTVIISSHVMSLVERMCTHVAVVNHGRVCAAGTVAEVAAGEDLEECFLQLVGGRHAAARLDWLDGAAPSAPATPTSATPALAAPAFETPYETPRETTDGASR